MFRVALVGAGGMAGMHASCYAAIDNAELVGVMDIREAAAQALAASLQKMGWKPCELLWRLWNPSRPESP